MTKNQSPLTKKDVYEIVNKVVTQATDAILTGIDNIIKEMVTKEEFKTEIKKIDNRLNRLESDVTFIKDDIKGLTAELSTTKGHDQYQYKH